MLSAKITYDGLCEGLDLYEYLSLLYKTIEASGYVVDVTIKHDWQYSILNISDVARGCGD